MDDKHPNAEVILKTGDLARDFALPDTDGMVLSLSAVLQQKPVILVFYRGDW
jgi:peroxiredoxin